MNRQRVESDPDRDMRLARDLDNWAAQGRLLLRRVALHHAETGTLRDETCQLMGVMGHLVADAPAGPVGAYVGKLAHANRQGDGGGQP